jgi:hypothetical protein
MCVQFPPLFNIAPVDRPHGGGEGLHYRGEPLPVESTEGSDTVG